MYLLLYLVVKAQQYVFCKLELDKKTLLNIWLNPGLNLTIFQGTGPLSFFARVVFCSDQEHFSSRESSIFQRTLSQGCFNSKKFAKERCIVYV